MPWKTHQKYRSSTHPKNFGAQAHSRAFRDCEQKKEIADAIQGYYAIFSKYIYIHTYIVGVNTWRAMRCRECKEEIERYI